MTCFMRKITFSASERNEEEFLISADPILTKWFHFFRFLHRRGAKTYGKKYNSMTNNCRAYIILRVLQYSSRINIHDTDIKSNMERKVFFFFSFSADEISHADVE